MENDTRVKAPCPACRQMILLDRMGKHLRKAHRYDLRRTKPYDDIRQGIGRVVVAKSSSGLPTSHGRPPVTTGKNTVGAIGTQKPLRRLP